MKLIRNLLSNEVFRFLMSGGSLFVLDLTTFVICRKVFLIEVPYAEFIARSVGATTGFILHKFFTFANPKGQSAMSTRKQGVGYTLTAAFNLILSPFLISWLVALFYPYEILAKAFGTILLAIETFIVFRFVFRGSKNSDSDKPHDETIIQHG